MARFRPLTAPRAWLFALAVLFSLLPPAFGQEPFPNNEVLSGRSRAAAAALLRSYNPHTGLFDTTGWWNSANAVTALADESRLTGDTAPSALFPQILLAAPHKFPGFLNKFYDDEGWWALAWIDVYELDPHSPGAKQYFETAATIFADMAGGWDDACSGGIWWSKDRKYKNAIANELFLSVAAKLALDSRGAQRKFYLDWARREWRWFQQSGMINAEGLVNDGLDASCRNNGRTTWSYNQGVVLGGLAALRRGDKHADVLPSAQRIATAAITRLTDPDGILHDPCEPECGEDGVSFKGIFTRNLAQLQLTTGDPAFVHFLQANAVSLWTRARTPEDRFSTTWSGPPVAGNAGAQASALDALNAAAAVATRP